MTFSFVRAWRSRLIRAVSVFFTSPDWQQKMGRHLSATIDAWAIVVLPVMFVIYLSMEFSGTLAQEFYQQNVDNSLLWQVLSLESCAVVHLLRVLCRIRDMLTFVATPSFHPHSHPHFTLISPSFHPHFTPIKQAIALYDPRRPFYYGQDSQFLGLNNTGVMIENFDYRDPMYPNGRCHRNLQYVGAEAYAAKWLSMEDRNKFNGDTCSPPITTSPTQKRAMEDKAGALGSAVKGTTDNAAADDEIILLRRELSILQQKEKEKKEAMARSREEEHRKMEISSLKAEIQALRKKQGLSLEET